jgi:hypothetical protein
MIAGIGALNLAVADGTNSYRRCVRSMLLANILCALRVMVGAIGGTCRLDVLLVPASFASGMMAALGTTQADLGTTALVTLIAFAAKPVGPQQALVLGALALSGGLFQIALTWVVSVAVSGLVL